MTNENKQQLNSVRYKLSVNACEQQPSADVVEKVARAIWKERQREAKENLNVIVEDYDTPWGDSNIAEANNILGEAKAAIFAYEAAIPQTQCDWQDINTAPKDGTLITIWSEIHPEAGEYFKKVYSAPPIKE